MMKKLISIVLLSGYCAGCNAANFSFSSDTSARLDIRSDKSPRWQYRVRFYPQWSFSDNLSLNAFANTGNRFSSSYNTMDDGKADYFYLRRFYLRHQQEQGKTEFGVIPTYKGPVASTGLSKDGWITGLRQVFAVNPQSKLEFVIGELEHIDKPNAFESFDELNYFEMEYSSALSSKTGFEISTERMLGANFLRAELRHDLTHQQQYAIELIHRPDTGNAKVVLSVTRAFPLFDNPAKLFAYYSYVDRNFGPRAELTEDFLDSGHALSVELTGAFYTSSALKWFAKLQHYQHNDTSRVQLGLQYKFSQG